jgi:general transcription factor 3C polypeptide 5 (transcription factor C subunit 1)
MDPNRTSIPFYLTPESAFDKPIASHNARTHNVVLKVTMPKRTGRKRKRGSDEPWQGDIGLMNDDTGPPEPVQSRSRLDDPKILRRKLEDNVGNYSVEAVGVVKHTHRFRGSADFSWDMTRSKFAQNYASQVLPGDGKRLKALRSQSFCHRCADIFNEVQQLKQFSFMPGRDSGPEADILPPPIFTHMGVPYNYFYSQNPYVRHTEDGNTINTTAVKQVGYFISIEDPAPDGPQIDPDMTDPRMVEAVAQLEDAFKDRPVWTRRSLLNHLGGKLRNWNELKKYLNYVAYQFKGGPWRDGVVPYGIDPRTDPKYRFYQTVMFKIPAQARAENGQSWHSLRQAQMGPTRQWAQELSESHIFDGETYHTDGKVWQICDITDPLLKQMIDEATIRPSLDPSSGWYHGGLWAKIKAIMKTKLVAIQFGRHLSHSDFASALEAGDKTPVRENGIRYKIALPNLHLTNEELTQLRGYEPSKKKRQQSYSVRVRDPSKGLAERAEGPLGAHAADQEPEVSSVVEDKMGDEGSDDENWNSGSDDDEMDDQSVNSTMAEDE